MIVFLSPSKTFTPEKTAGISEPIFKHKNRELFLKLMALDSVVLKERLSISDKLWTQVLTYYQEPTNLAMAVKRYGGIVYKQLEAVSFLKEHTLYILDAFYGLVRSTDAIMKYRLDFSFDRKLHEFWQKDVHDYLLTHHKDELCIDLSSQEFAFLIPKDLNCYKIEFALSDRKIPNTTLKIMRGKMANYLLSHSLKRLDELKTLVLDGFTYSSELSSEKLLVFVK